MKKITTNVILSVLMVVSTGAYAESYNARILGVSGTGVASADFGSGGVLNPALIADFSEKDVFNINLNGGGVVSDEDDFIDAADDLVNIFESIDGQNPQTILPELENLRSGLLAFDNSTLRVDAGGSLQATISKGSLSTGLFITGELSLGATTNISATDFELIDDLINGSIPSDPNFNGDDLLSSILTTGVLTSEVGISFAKSFSIAGHEVAFGVSPKYQFVETFVYLVQIANFDEDDFDGDQYTEEDSNFNVDFGLQTSFLNWKFGATLRNAISKDYETVTSRVVKSSPLLTLGTAYKNNWLNLAVDVDVNAVEEPVTQKDVQFARIGVEFDISDWVQLRLGYRHDLEGTFDDTASIGFGLSPFGVVNLDLAIIAGDNETLGAALQLGLTF